MTRTSMIARLVALGAVGLLTMGAQSSCSVNNGEGTLEVTDGNQDADPGTGTNTGPTFSTTLTLKDSSGKITSQFARGELITFELSVLNRTNAPITLRFPSMGGYNDFYVYKPATDEARWEYLANKIFPAVVTDITFEAGNAHVFSGTWDQVKLNGDMLESGTHEAYGLFLPINGQTPALTQDETRSPRVTFTVN
jgi:intracellular proteinase inhibitor BsuPI